MPGAVGRALGVIISKFRNLKNVYLSTFSKMYQANVVPIEDYSSSVWGYANYYIDVKVQYKAMKVFLGVHPMTPLLGPQGDMGWENCNVNHFWLFWNKHVNISPKRLIKWIFICTIISVKLI